MQNVAKQNDQCGFGIRPWMANPIQTQNLIKRKKKRISKGKIRPIGLVKQIGMMAVSKSVLFEWK